MRAKRGIDHHTEGENVGIKGIGEKIWLVSWMQYNLGFFGHESVRVEWHPTRSS